MQEHYAFVLPESETEGKVARGWESFRPTEQEGTPALSLRRTPGKGPERRLGLGTEGPSPRGAESCRWQAPPARVQNVPFLTVVAAASFPGGWHCCVTG